MADPDWPGEFPQKPLTASLSVGLVSPAQRTDTEHLLPIQRRRSSVPVVGWQVAWRFENEGANSQYQLFVAWLHFKLAGATLPFNWPVWDGQAFVSKKTWFAADPVASVEVAGLRVVVPAQLLIVDPPMISEATLDANIT